MIARAEQVIGEHITAYTAEIAVDAPRLQFVRVYGVGYAALGRKVQAERRLKALEARMDDELLAVARAIAEEVASGAADEANRELNRNGKRLSNLMRVSREEVRA